MAQQIVNLPHTKFFLLRTKQLLFLDLFLLREERSQPQPLPKKEKVEKVEKAEKAKANEPVDLTSI